VSPQLAGRVYPMGEVSPQLAGRVYPMGEVSPQLAGRVYPMGEVFPQLAGHVYPMDEVPPQLAGRVYPMEYVEIWHRLIKYSGANVGIKLYCAKKNSVQIQPLIRIPKQIPLFESPFFFQPAGHP